MVKEPDRPYSLSKRVALTAMYVVGVVSMAVNSGCGSVRGTIGSGVPKLPSKDNAFYGIVRQAYDQRMDELRWQNGQDMEARAKTIPHNESVEGALYFGSFRF